MATYPLMQYPESDQLYNPVMYPNAYEETAEKKEGAVAALEEEERFRLFHLKAVLISGVGFFTDSYDLQVISSVQTQMAMARWPGTVSPAYQGDLAQHGPGNLPTVTSLEMSIIALVGTLSGQLIFGVLGDRLGRKGAYTVTLGTMITMTILQSAACWGSQNLFTALFLLWRFWLGVGIGGEYPLSAVISSEYASTKLRGPMIVATFSMQGLGALLAACVGMATTAGFRNTIITTCSPAFSCWAFDASWRIIMGLGCLPAILTFYLRYKLPESPRFTAQVDHEEELANANAKVAIDGEKVQHYEAHGHKDRINTKDFFRFICRRKNLLILVGTASAWFLLDAVFYSQSLFTPDILTNIGFNPSLTMQSTGLDMYTKAYKTCAGNGIILLIGTVPGYYPPIFLINRMGRIKLQLLGFVIMTITLVIMASAYPQLLPTANNAASINGTPWAYMLLFALMFFFANTGPNTTTFVLPGELYPTKFRSTCHGISAAFGKLGAIVGAFGFGWMVVGASNHISNSYPMDTKIHASQLSLGLLAICCFLGFCSTFLIPEPTGLSLEETAAMFFDLDEDENDMMDKDPEGNGAVDYPVFADEFSGYTAPNTTPAGAGVSNPQGVVYY
jgi:PHS family inorganic phosphate transporter-like MFS transporter